MLYERYECHGPANACPVWGPASGFEVLLRCIDQEGAGWWPFSVPFRLNRARNRCDLDRSGVWRKPFWHACGPRAFYSWSINFSIGQRAQSNTAVEGG